MVPEWLPCRLMLLAATRNVRASRIDNVLLPRLPSFDHSEGAPLDQNPFLNLREYRSAIPEIHRNIVSQRAGDPIAKEAGHPSAHHRYGGPTFRMEGASNRDLLWAMPHFQPFREPSSRGEVSASTEARVNEIDPWERAAQCHRQVSAANDPERKAIFENLRELWIAIGNAQAMVTTADLAEEIEAVDRLHVDLIGEAGRLH